jgi:hypothetical protein
LGRYCCFTMSRSLREQVRTLFPCLQWPLSQRSLLSSRHSERYNISVSGGEIRYDWATSLPLTHLGNTTNLFDPACSGVCAAGYFCPEGSLSAFQIECGSSLGLENSVYCLPGSSSPVPVPDGYYSLGGNKTTRFLDLHRSLTQ